MPDILKGNFKTKNSIAVEPAEKSLESQFEQAALKRLGGSIAFVSKRKVMWDAADVAKKTPDKDR